MDDEIRPFDDLPEGETTVKMAVDFNPLSDALTGSRTRAVAGDAIKSINSLCVLVYDVDGNFLDKQTPKFEVQNDTKRTSEDKGVEWSGKGIAENETPRATFDMKIPYGYYRIYAVANMGDMAAYEEEIKTVKGLKGISLTWQSDVTQNNQMLGYFMPEGTYTDNDILKISRPNMKLHAGVKRVASKVTVAFDGSDLNEGVFIYIKSVQIKDIPKTCFLGDKNTPTSRENDLMDGDTIRYDLQKDDKGNVIQAPFNEYYLARIARGKPFFPYQPDDPYKSNFHTETERSLFFYENMQGVHEDKDKRQDANGDGVLDHPGISDPDKEQLPTYREKDGVECGTYIEVEAYYYSIHEDRVGAGDIIYRFMLGKDVTTDYNAERNHHYKLTLKFNKFANNVDWHIDYYEPMPSIQVPEPYYISYLYNHNMMLPVKVNIPEGATLKSLEALIDTNSWAPYGVQYLDYHKDLDPYYTGFKGPLENYNGFLSLRMTTETVIAGKEGVPDKQVNEEYYNTYQKGYRKYEVTPGTYDKDRDKDGKEEGTYYVSDAMKSSKSGMKSINFSIPMYTRAKQLVSTTGYTGNNPYVAYQRKATVKFTAIYTDRNGKEDTIHEHTDIRQVRRVVNPKGVWRKAGNNTPFHVTLKRLPRENATMFQDFVSEGKWRAFVVGSTHDFIDLGSDTVRGSTGSLIDFEIGFKGVCGANENRCAIIRVEYHDYSCVHLMFIRQGDAPMALETKDRSKWHAYNMRTKDTEAESVAEEGSLFKFGNWDEPIDATNNVNDKNPWVDVSSSDFKDHSTTLFKIAGTGEEKLWSDIKSEPAASGAFANTKLKNGKECRVADASAYNELYLSKDIEFGYGVLYGDDATKTLSDIREVYGYLHNQANKGYGMRGIFVYNSSDKGDGYRSRNMFLPIGNSGYGHRKGDKSEGGKLGVLRYSSGRNNVLADDRPLFYDLYMRPGAIYWLDKNTTVWRNGSKIDNIIGWDINYFTFDFNFMPFSNVFVDGINSDACFVRCIDMEKEPEP